MEYSNDENDQSSLFWASITLWFISLLLPAFEYDGNIWVGGAVLFMGVLFGFLGAPQAYSNIMFFIAWYKIFRGKPSGLLSTFTFLLGFSSFAITALPEISDVGGFYPILYWGWGSILWITSYLLLLIAAIRQEDLSIFPRRKIIGTVILFFLTVLLVGRCQYNSANSDERKRLFNQWTAFVPLGQLSFIPYNPINFELTPNTIIEFRGKLKIDYSYDNLYLNRFKIRLPDYFIYQKKYYTLFDNWVFIREMKHQPDYIISFRQERSNRFIAEIAKSYNTSPIWSAKIIQYKKDNQYPNYFSYSWYEPIRTHENLLYQQQLNNATFTAVDFQKLADSEYEDTYRLSLLNNDSLVVHRIGTVSRFYQHGKYIMAVEKGGKHYYNITLFDLENNSYSKTYSKDLSKYNLSFAQEFPDEIIVSTTKGSDKTKPTITITTEEKTFHYSKSF